ncbi:MAG: hypothetical protein CBB97_06545 [Candidatus Endolissoclinum sp. TMED37]|nr:MAG: hypothetical protein CBB97_06545 [Candidatus Endolissoclinum sp. TMED37]|tara:strand:+ start:1161 stop:1781 length:621 start_codon:yes stop_codon:yes gene_type:complete
MKIQLIIFDLDGVLINSLNNMKYALINTEKKMKIDLKFNLYKRYLGLPFEEIMKKMNIYKDINKIKKNYEYFSKKKINKIKISKEFLTELTLLKKNYKLAVFTSKNKTRTHKILSQYVLFDCIITSDDIKKGKPNPEGLKKILSILKIKNKNCIFVGDSIYDYHASKSAKIKYLHAMWGYEKKINRKNNIIKIKEFSDIHKIVNNF